MTVVLFSIFWIPTCSSDLSARATMVRVAHSCSISRFIISKKTSTEVVFSFALPLQNCDFEFVVSFESASTTL